MSFIMELLLDAETQDACDYCNKTRPGDKLIRMVYKGREGKHVISIHKDCLDRKLGKLALGMADE